MQVKSVERTSAMFSLQRTTSGRLSRSRAGERGQGSQCQSGLLPQHTSVSEHGRESHPANAMIKRSVRHPSLSRKVRGWFNYYRGLWCTRTGSSVNLSHIITLTSRCSSGACCTGKEFTLRLASKNFTASHTETSCHAA